MTNKEVKRPLSDEPITVRYLNSRGIAAGLPVSGNFELTARCNFNCKMCYIHKSNAPEFEKGELSADEWLGIASDARDKGLIFLLLTGGEPLIRRDFPQIYTELVKMGIVVSINTNASLYGGEIRELFNRYPPSRFNVTLYGGSEETYERLCGNASFAKVTENLRTMKSDGQQVRLNVTLSRYNVGDMEKINAIANEIGLHTKTSAYLYPPVRRGGEIGYNEARFTPEEAGRVITRWSRIHDSDDILIRRAQMLRENQAADIVDNCSEPSSEGEGVKCRAGRSSFWLTWDGRMLPCGTMDVEPSYPLRDGFGKAWEEVRARTAAIRLPVECSTCADRDNCSVCASICKCETGRFDCKPEYICGMVRSMREGAIAMADEIIRKRNNENQV